MNDFIDDADSGIVVDGRVTGESKFETVVDLAEECFDWAGGMPSCCHVEKVLIEVIGGNFSVG